MLTILITGPPKSGKTTTAVAIARLLTQRGQRVKLDDGEFNRCRDIASIAGELRGDFNASDPTVQIVTEQVRK